MPNQLQSVFGRNFAILGEKRFSRFAVVPYEPKLVFDFPSTYYRTGGVDRSSLSDAMTFARAGSATYVDATGTLQTAAAGVPRVGHHVWNGSAWVNEGLLHESEARTNLVTNNQLGGAVVGVIGSGGALPTGWSSSNFDTVEVVSVDTWRGMPRIRVKGTRANATGVSVFPNLFLQTSLTLAATSGYTGSLWFGEGPDQTGSRASLLLSDGPTFFVNQQISAPGTLAEPVFFNRTGTATGSPTAFGSMRLAATVEDGNTEVFDWVIVMPQMELGATPSSPIPTSGSTVTRAAETLTIPAANLPWPTPEYIGPELVTNGTFDTDTTGWTAAFGSISWSDGKLLLTEDGADGSSARAYQIITTEVGKVYRITVDVGAVSLGGVVIAASDSIATGGKPQVVASQNTSAELVFVAETTATYIVLQVQGVTARTAEFDNISVREINPLAVSIAMEGTMTYADTDKFGEVRFFSWGLFPADQIRHDLDTNGSDIGQFRSYQLASSVDSSVTGPIDSYSPGVLVPFNLAGRHGSTFVNGAVDGTALTANTTPTALPDLSDTNLSLGPTFMGTIRTFRMWPNDIGDTGIEEASA